MIIDTFIAQDDEGLVYYVNIDQKIRTKGTGSKMSQIFGEIRYFDQFGHTVVPIAGHPDLWEIAETGVRIQRTDRDASR